MASLIAYLRRPDGRSEDDTASLDAERNALRTWARHKRHRIVDVIVDDPSAASLDRRSGLVDAVAAARQPDMDGLVLYRLADLAPELVEQEQLLAELRGLGVKVYTLSAEEAAELRNRPADPLRQLVRRVLQAAADNERSLIAFRAASRTPNGATPGSPAYGFRVLDGDRVPDPAEQAALTRIAELRAEGATLREIARALEAEGHPAKRAQGWHPETLRRIVNRLQS
jgi:DNA invertase Pin-like site-specific DNA recombinase